MLDVLENRQTISDTLFAGLQAVGAGLWTSTGGERELFGATNFVDRSVSGAPESTSIPATFARAVAGDNTGPVRQTGSSAYLPRQAVADASEDSSDATQQPARGTESPATIVIGVPDPVGILVLGGDLGSHGRRGNQERETPQTAFGGGSVAADTAARSSPTARRDSAGSEIPNADVDSSSGAGNHDRIVPPIPPVADRGAGQAHATPSAVPGGETSAAAGSAVAQSSASESSAATLSPPAMPAGPSAGPHRDDCASDARGHGGAKAGGASEASGGGGARGHGDGQPCGQSRHMSSVADPLFVIDLNDGLTLFPDVKEYEFPGRPVDLRAQVYGATVSSYSWDTSDAPEATNVSGDSTYRLQFDWDSDPTWQAGELYKTETIAVTATMIDNSEQSLTLTFPLLNASGGVGAATWPDVLAPDRPLDSRDVVASDSATRPYAVSLESGVLYVGHELPAYNPGVPALGLNYSSSAAERRPIFVNRYELDPNAAVPNTVSARLQFDGSWGPSKYYDTSPSTTKFNPGDILQISLQANGGNLATGRYDYSFESTAHYSGSSTTSTYSGTVSIINEESSIFGEGWTLETGVSGRESGVSGNLFNRLHVVTGGVILNQGAGNSLWFEADGGDYTTPAGDFSSLVQNQDDTFTRTLTDGTTQNFSESGLLTSLVDRNGNTITFGYDESERLVSITDANDFETTFSYAGACGATGKVCSITDPADRVTTFSYDASGRLASITDPDDAVWNYSYDSSSGRMAGMEDPLDNATGFDFDFAGRVSTVTRPDATTESFAALQVQSLCASGDCTQGQPGTPLLAAEAVADYTDPRGFDWDYRLDWNGLGSVTQITDPLGTSDPAGHMTVVHRDSNGLASMFTDRLDRNSFFDRDSSGNVTTLTHPDLTTQLYEFNSFAEVTESTDELGRVTTYEYDTAGNLTEITEADPDGAGPLSSPVTTMDYDSQGRMTALTDGREFTTSFEYDTRDRVTEITYPDDDTDPNNNPTVTLGYDDASNLTSRTDERGNATTLEYDAAGRVTSMTTPDRDGAGGLPAPETTYSFDSAGNLIEMVRPDPDGSGSLDAPVWTFSFDAMNRTASVSDPLNNTTSVDYDAAGNVVAVTDPLNRTTSFEINELGHQIAVTTPLAHTTSYEFDAEGQLLSITDPLDRTSTMTYNSRGWLASYTDPTDATWAFGYDAVGNRTSADDPLSSDEEAFVYDDLNRLISSADQLGHTTQYAYDAVGNRTGVTDALGHTTNYSFDARNRLVAVTQPDPDGSGPLESAVTTFTFDAAGNNTAVTDPLERTTSYDFDPANRLTSITQPDPDGSGPLENPVIAFDYDNLDRLTALTDPVDNVTSWNYDAIDQVLTEMDPLSNETSYTRDAAGQLTRIVDRKNQRRDFAYDDDGRRTHEYWCPADSGSATGCGTSTPIRDFSSTYDDANQLIEVEEPDSHYTFDYDAAGRVTEIASLASNMPQVTLTNNYDDAGNRTSVSDDISGAPGLIEYIYDDANRMIAAAMTVGGDPGPAVAFGYDDANRLTSLSRSISACETCFPDDRRINTDFDYDSADRLTGITHSFYDGSTSTPLAEYSYIYNVASELTSETNTDGTFDYSYDATSQLIGVSVTDGTGVCEDPDGAGPDPSPCDETFAYDENGNRTASSGYSLNQTYTTDTGNRLSSDGIYDYTYDDNGNTLTKTRISDGQKHEFSWDFRNRLMRVLLKNSGGTILQQSDYTFDAFDRRIINRFDDDGPGPHSATVTKTLYDGASFVADAYADFDGSNTLTMRYLFGPSVDMILARRDSSGIVAWQLADHLATVRDIVNLSGTVLDHLSYSAFGTVVAESSPTNGDHFKFASREYDPVTGIRLGGTWYYDPAIGRFIGLAVVENMSRFVRVYRYVVNNPTLLASTLGPDLEPRPYPVPKIPPADIFGPRELHMRGIFDEFENNPPPPKFKLPPLRPPRRQPLIPVPFRNGYYA